MAEKKTDQDETERKEATVLPAREAMTIISSSAPAEERVTSEDRSEHFENDDTASSET